MWFSMAGLWVGLQADLVQMTSMQLLTGVCQWILCLAIGGCQRLARHVLG